MPIGAHDLNTSKRPNHTCLPGRPRVFAVCCIEPGFNRPRQSSPNSGACVYVWVCTHTKMLLISSRGAYYTIDYYSVNTIQCRHFRRANHIAIYRLKWISWELISFLAKRDDQSEGYVTDTGSPSAMARSVNCVRHTTSQHIYTSSIQAYLVTRAYRIVWFANDI